MSIYPDMEKWKRRFAACLGLAVATLFLTGAMEVGHELRSRPARLGRVAEAVRRWGRTVAREGASAAEADSLTADDAAFVLRACTVSGTAKE